MFSDTSFTCFDVQSSWKKQMITKESDSQTDSISTVEKEVQYSKPESKASQTLNTPIVASNSYDEHRVLAFVRKASKTTIDELNKLKSNYMYDILDKLEANQRSGATLLRKYMPQNLSELNSDLNVSYEMSSLSWNSNASVLATSYGINGHTDWCTHESYVYLWNMFESSTSGRRPSTILETESCISVLAAHPIQPSLYAVATINGKIALFNTRNSENDMLFCSVSAHQSRVTGLQWLATDKRNVFGVLVSSGLDGRILVWNLQKNSKTLTVSDAFVVLAEDLPRSLAVKIKSDTEVGIVGMSFNEDDESIFVIACHGGAIFQCSLNSTTKRSSHSSHANSIGLTIIENVSFKSPIVLSFAPHRGHITALQFSPFSRNIFFSCSVDSELRIYSILQTKPIMVIHTEIAIINAQWSPSRPNIAAISEDGNVYIYCINKARVSKPEFSFKIGDHIKANLLMYNKIDCDEQLAISASNGEIQIWDLSKCTKSFDRKDLNAVFKKITEDEV